MRPVGSASKRQCIQANSCGPESNFMTHSGHPTKEFEGHGGFKGPEGLLYNPAFEA